jgi:hypothetical protein
MVDMQMSIPDTRAFNQFTTAMAPYRVFNNRRQLVAARRGYFDVGAGGVLGGLEVPEPSGIILLITALGVLFVLRGRAVLALR